MNDSGFGRRTALAEVRAQTIPLFESPKKQAESPAPKSQTCHNEINTKETFVTGIKFLWWTWHDTDAPIDYRILGVPIGSTVWVITFTGE